MARDIHAPGPKKWRTFSTATLLLSQLIAFYIRLCYFTSRVQFIIPASAEPYKNGERQAIFAFWHGRMLMMPVANPHRRNMYIMISRHGDGELIAQAMKRFGFGSVRGSSRKSGFAAASGALKLLADGNNLSITPDGPRGPLHVAAAGVAAIAAKSGVPVVAVTFSAKHHCTLGSWDKFLLVRPFTQLIFIASEPLWISEESNETIEEGRNTVEASLRHITQQADSYWSTA